jgi:hypothetical protein
VFQSRLELAKENSIESVLLRKLIDLAQAADSLQEPKLRRSSDLAEVRRRFAPLAEEGFQLPAKSALVLTEKYAEELLAEGELQKWLVTVNVWASDPTDWDIGSPKFLDLIGDAEVSPDSFRASYYNSFFNDASVALCGNCETAKHRFIDWVAVVFRRLGFPMCRFAQRGLCFVDATRTPAAQNVRIYGRRAAL